MNKSTRYFPEVRNGRCGWFSSTNSEYDSQWAAIGSIAEKIGCTAETLRKWVRRTERDQGLRAGLSSDERARLKTTGRMSGRNSAQAATAKNWYVAAR